MYKDVFWKSIKNLKFSVFIPDTYLMVVHLVLIFLYFKFTGVFALMSNPNFIAASIEEQIPLLRLFISENMLTLLFYFIIFGFTSFILGASLNSMRYGMIRDIVMGEKFSFRKVLNYGARFWPIVLVRIIVFVLGVVAFLFILGSYLILKAYYPGVFALFMITLFAVAAVLLLRLLFLFTYAIMFFEGKGAFTSVKESFVYFFKNKGYVFKVFLIILLLSIVIFPFEFAFSHYQNLFGLLSFYTILFLVIRNLASVFYTVWSEVLIFYSYRARGLSP